jgi:hypothetical protein
MSEQKLDDTLAGDLIYGANAIAEELGITYSRAKWQIETGAIPTTRMGRLIVASKTTLRRKFAPARDGEAA